MAILLWCSVKVGVTRIGAFVKETIAVIIFPGVDLNQEERVFLSGLFFVQRMALPWEMGRNFSSYAHREGLLGRGISCNGLK
jgi:hypothetical protein